jgi:hypothetical protein
MAEILAAPTRWILTLLSAGGAKDFSRYDAYFNALPVLFLPGENRKATTTLQLRPVKADTGQSEFEARPEFGDWFAQGDFSGGKGQRFFHRPGRDDSKYLISQGFDISEPGVLRHLNDTAEADNTNITDPRSVAVFNDLPFVAQGGGVWRGDGNFPGTWTLEDTDAGEAGAIAWDLATDGDILFLAYGTGGVHWRNTGAVWDHLATSTPTDLDTGDTRIVRWLKDRLIVIGGAGRKIYEIPVANAVAGGSATPTAIETIPLGWEFTDVFESGPFILATAANPTSGLSRVHTYGLNSGASAIEKKTSSPMPKGVLVMSGISLEGRIFLGGGRALSTGGYSAMLFEALTNASGELQTLLIAEEGEGSTVDLSVRAFETTSNSIIFGWGRENSSIYGRFVGLARYNLARNAFSHYLSTTTASDQKINDVTIFEGRVLIAVDNDGLFYEKVGTPTPEAWLVTSVADWSNTGLKAWDLFEITHNALNVGVDIQLDYTKKNPDEEDWQLVMVSDTPGSTGKATRLEGIESRSLTLKITSSAIAGTDPEFLAFGVRSMPAPADTEWRLVRTVRVFDEDRKNAKAEIVHQDPRTLRAQLQDLAHTFVTVYEPGVTWIAYVEDVAEVEPGSSIVSETAGTSEREAFYLELRMVARRAA